MLPWGEMAVILRFEDGRTENFADTEHFEYGYEIDRKTQRLSGRRRG